MRLTITPISVSEVTSVCLTDEQRSHTAEEARHTVLLKVKILTNIQKAPPVHGKIKYKGLPFSRG